METVRPSVIQKCKDIYEFMDKHKDPTDNRTRLFSHEIATPLNMTAKEVAHGLTTLTALECIKLIKRSSGSYYPSVYELIEPPTTAEYLRYRERSNSLGVGGLKIRPTPQDRNRMDIEDLKSRVTQLEEIVKSMLAASGQLEIK